MRFPLIIGLHNHQPYKNFSYVIEQAVNESYLPFIEVASKYPNFKFTLHYSGWLLEQIIHSHKPLLLLLKKMVDNGQIEFFGGGYYEPILSAIPSPDRRGQLRKLTHLISNVFGVKPKGIWLTERVWDSSIIPDLVECDIEDVILDDYHFLTAGYHEESLAGYYTTEHDGYMINIFPIDQNLRYLIPFHKPKEIITYVEESRDNNKKFLMCFDDGEKFGLWPKTSEWVYKNGWLESFIEEVLDNNDIAISHFSDIKRDIKPSGLVYLPPVSYAEMGQWSLFADSAVEFKKLEEFVGGSEFSKRSKMYVKGGIWKNFFSKYPESNKIHKRTLRLSMYNRKITSEYGVDNEFREHMYASQCNDCLWHGVFGGLYLPNLRGNVWESIINAELCYEKILELECPNIEVDDIDLDGYDDIYLRTKNVNIQFTARDGGQVTTLEYKKKPFNFLNTLARRFEEYHENIKDEVPQSTHNVNDENISSIHESKIYINSEQRKHLVYDWYNKNSFIDHFVHRFDKNEFLDMRFKELGDFVDEPFDSKIIDKCHFKFERHGGIYTEGNVKNSCLLKKYYIFEKNTLKASYDIKSSITCDYVQEHNFHFADLDKIKINGVNFDPNGLYFVTSSLSITDSYTGASILLKWDREMDICIYPVNTISLAVDKVELTTQGISIFGACSFDKELVLNVELNVV